MSRLLDFKNKKVLVMGLGKFGGGVGVTKWLVTQGAKVTVTDMKTSKELADPIRELEISKLGAEIRWELGEHDPKLLDEHEILAVNPAVRPNNEFLKVAQQKGLQLTTEINLFFERCQGKVIGVTGTNGKETVARMIAGMLQKGGENVIIGGNIGVSLLGQLDKITKMDWVVLELSSFQLERLAWIKKSPHVGVVLNITPDHLDWHGTFKNYINAKANILKFQTRRDIAILNVHDSNIEKLTKFVKGALVSVNRIDQELQNYIKLPGRHNLWNATIASAVVKKVGIRQQSIHAALSEFRATEHALEFVCERNGVKIYDDSEATTPAASIAALESFNRPIVLIAGGVDKQLDLSPLAKAIVKKVVTLVTVGQTGPRIGELVRNFDINDRVQVLAARNFKQAVDIALSKSKNGMILLLSPACASYDMFNNLQERGKLFKKLTCNG